MAMEGSKCTQRTRGEAECNNRLLSWNGGRDVYGKQNKKKKKLYCEAAPKTYMNLVGTRPRLEPAPTFHY